MGHNVRAFLLHVCVARIFHPTRGRALLWQNWSGKMLAARRVLCHGRGTGAPWLGRQCATSSSSLDDAAAQTIALLRQHPGLLKEVQRRRCAEAPSTGSVAPLGRSAYDRAFAEADSDGDGHLSKEEFRRWTLRRGGQYDLSGAMRAEAEAEAEAESRGSESRVSAEA